MPSTLETPVLQVDANVIHKVDTSNPQNLSSMWTVFARCADSVEQGRRLENLSWRLWTRETFCVESGRAATAPTTSILPQTIPQPNRPSTDDIPQLSGSVDSIVEEEAPDINNAESSPVDIRPMIRRQDSCASSRSRGKERHITSDDLEKMVVSIVHQKQPLTAPLPQISPPYAPVEPAKKVEPIPALERSGSTSTESPSKASDLQSLDA